LSVELRTPLAISLMLGIPLGFLIIQDLYELIPFSGQTGDLLINVFSRIQSLSGNIFLFLLLSVGLEISKPACVTFFRLIPWEEIESYDWRQSPAMHLLFLRLKLHNNPLLLQRSVDPARKERVDQILLEHLPQGGTGVTTVGSADLLEWGEREPANRLLVPSLALLISGIMQIAAALFVMIIFALRLTV